MKPNENTPIPPLGGRSAAQSPNYPIMGGAPPFGIGGGGMLGPGGSLANPMGYQGWGSAYMGTYDVYRWILQHPVVRAARSVVISPIISNTSTYEADDDVPEEYIKFIQRKFDRLIARGAVRESLRGVDMGCAKFEPIWARDDDGYLYIDYLKPLRIDTTAVFTNFDGTLAGFTTNVKNGTEAIEMPADKSDGTATPLRLDLSTWNCTAWMYTYDGEAGNLHGRSQLENFRETAWAGWLTTAQQIALIGGKISSRQAYALVPVGGYTDPSTGQNRTYAQDAADASGMFLAGKCPIFVYPVTQDLNGSILDTKPLVQFQSVDFGDNGPAITSLKGMLDYWNDMIFLGWLRSPRTGLEGTHGTKAEAESHGSTGDLNSEAIDDDIAGQMQPLIDYTCKVNWNLRAGSIRRKPDPIVDRKAQRAMAILQSVNSSQGGSALIAQHLNVRKLLESLDAPVTDEGEDSTADVLGDANNPPVAAPPVVEPKPAAKRPVQMSNESSDQRQSLSADAGEVFDQIAEYLSFSNESSDLSGGAWRTINGAHVYMKDGIAVAGPDSVVKSVNDGGKWEGPRTPNHLIGRSQHQIEQHGKSPTKSKEGYHPIERNAVGDYLGTRGEDGKISYVQEHADRLAQNNAPPAHTDVYLSKDPEADAPVTGKDSKGKTQAPRSEAAAKRAKVKKFARNEQFHDALPAIRERLEADLGGKNAEEAAALSLVDKTGFRIGGEEDTGAKVQATGATTLNASHLKIEGDKLHFTFIGKKGVLQDHVIEDPKLAKMLAPRLAKGGDLFDTNDSKTGAYLKQISGNDEFLNKDFRTEVAAETARQTIAKMPPPATIKELKAARISVSEVVAKKLGNNPAESLKSYIPPKVFGKWNANVAAKEQASLMLAHSKKMGMSEQAGGIDWIKNNAAAYREALNKVIE